jgi:hypothetical protein
MAATLGAAFGLPLKFWTTAKVLDYRQSFGLPPKFWPLVLLLVTCQFGASLWYAFSYIPFGRGVVTNVLPKPPTRLFR